MISKSHHQITQVLRCRFFLFFSFSPDGNEVCLCSASIQLLCNRPSPSFYDKILRNTVFSRSFHFSFFKALKKSFPNEKTQDLGKDNYTLLFSGQVPFASLLVRLNRVPLTFFVLSNHVFFKFFTIFPISLCKNSECLLELLYNKKRIESF